MKYISLIFILYCTYCSSIFAQSKDKRAVLLVKGNLKALSVSPDEKLWFIPYYDGTFFTNSIKEDWQKGPDFIKKRKNGDDLRPELDAISFFNKDTFIITGTIYSDTKKLNGLYFTQNGGKSWENKPFGNANDLPLSVFTLKTGQIWSGTTSGLYFSPDFGKTWQQQNTAIKAHSLFMQNSNTGIIGSFENEIYITNDNWANLTKIETPLDQQKFILNDRNTLDKIIEKAIIWQNFIVVNQHGHIFYTEISKINWQEFPTEITQFELDKNTQRLFATNKKNQVIVFSTPTNCTLFQEKALLSSAKDLKIVNNSIYILDHENELYKLSEQAVFQTIPYTNEYPIEQPKIIQKGKTLTWGLSGRHLYVTENNTENWQREYLLEKEYDDFRLRNDSNLIISKNEIDTYFYSLAQHKATPYTNKHLIDDFFKYPIKKATVLLHEYTQCFSSGTGTVTINYTIKDSLLKCNTITRRGFNRAKKNWFFKNKANINTLNRILKKAIETPDYTPTLNDFHITEQDKSDYLKVITAISAEGFVDFQEPYKSYYQSVPSKLYTLDSNYVAKYLTGKSESDGFNRSFQVVFTNQNNEELRISLSDYYIFWHFPCFLTYKSAEFKCYNIELLYYIGSLFPAGLSRPEKNNMPANKYLLLLIGQKTYLENEKIHQ